MTTFLEITNLVAANIYVVIAVLVAAELRRMSIGYPPVVVAFIVYFLVRVVDLLAAPDPFLGYSAALDAATDVVLLLVLLTYLLLHARRITRLAMATVNETQLRLAEYERARYDYATMVHAKLAGPLSIISGASQSLQISDDPKARAELAELTAESSAALRRISSELGEVRAGASPATGEASNTMRLDDER